MLIKKGRDYVIEHLAWHDITGVDLDINEVSRTRMANNYYAQTTFLHEDPTK